MIPLVLLPQCMILALLVMVFKMELLIGLLETVGEATGEKKDFSKLLEEQIT